MRREVDYREMPKTFTPYGRYRALPAFWVRAFPNRRLSQRFDLRRALQRWWLDTQTPRNQCPKDLGRKAQMNLVTLGAAQIELNNSTRYTALTGIREPGGMSLAILLER